MKSYYLQGVLLSARCVICGADDILWHYHMKSNNQIGILKPLLCANSNCLPLDAMSETIRHCLLPHTHTQRYT